MIAQLMMNGWRFATMILLVAALALPARAMAAQASATPMPGPDANAGTLVIEAVQSPADEPRVEFRVTSDAPWPVGDGFAAAAFDFTLTGPNGDQHVNTSDQAPGGLTTVNMLAGEYTLRDNDSGESVGFTIIAGQTTYVSVARYFVSNPAPPPTAQSNEATPVPGGDQTATTLPTTGSGPDASGIANAGIILFLLALAALTATAAVARARRAG